MAKTVLGIDVGYDTLKLALVSGGRVKKTATASMPHKLVKEGRVVSTETMGELLRTTMKENGIRAKEASLLLSGEAIFARNITMPQMNAEQLVYNLPFEFRDYITEELKDYVFDYAMISTGKEQTPAPEGEAPEKTEKSMELFGVAAPVSLMNESREMLRKAGLKLSYAAPAQCSYISLIRNLSPDKRPSSNEYCILDLGYKAVRMYMFKGDTPEASRVLEIGLSSIDDVIAEDFNVDVHLAHTYLLTDYEGCRGRESCMNAYNNIAIELMRALNFYRFSNPESHLEDVWLCGGGAAIEPLVAAIAQNLGMTVHLASSLLAGGEEIRDAYTLIQAIGAALV